ncbi:MAG TPA: Fe-S-containing hydro-lyase [Clostridiales bacterium]|nr:Fe-S-containing hydro-lyase [Clostridiales bacterium]
MDNVITLNTPLTRDIVRKLKAGDHAEISGVVYAARDAAHKRFIEMLDEGKELPFDIKDQVIYYVGPCPARPGEVIGSAGPTTSGRMDAYTPRLIELGLTGMIGKGLRSGEVVEAMKKYGAVYFGAVGGAGALLSRCIISEEIAAFPELGPEALRRLVVRNFPVVVVTDSEGRDLYSSGRESFQRVFVQKREG